MDFTGRCTLVQHMTGPSTKEDAKPHERELVSVLVEITPEDPDLQSGVVNMHLTNEKFFNKFVQGKMYTVSVEPV